MDGLSAAPRRPDHLRWMVLGVYVLSVVLSAPALDSTGLVLCPFRRATDLPCPGCGMTHAFIALGHGQAGAAWRYNALAIPLYAFGLVWLAGAFLGWRWPRVSRRAQGPALAVTLAIFMLYGLYRILVPAARPF